MISLDKLGSKVIPAAALAAALGAHAALADVTPDEVWAGWRDYLSAAGYEVEAVETRAGDRLTVSALSMRMPIPQDEATLTLRMGDLDFVDNGDGTVAIAIAPDLPLDITAVGPDGRRTDIGLSYTTRGLAINVSGQPGDLTYTYSAARLGLALRSLAVEGAPLDVDKFATASIELASLAGVSRMSGDGLRRVEQKLTTGPMHYLFDVRKPDGSDERMVMRGETEGLDMRGTVSMPSAIDAADMVRMLREGLAFDLALAYQRGSSEFHFKAEDQVAQARTSSGGGDLHMAMDKDGLVYSGKIAEPSSAMAGGELPFPIEFAMRELGFHFAMPVMAGDGPQPFRLGLTLAELSLSDMIWGIFDPTRQLPRDPATVAVDMSGSVRLTADLFDPAQMAALDASDAPPGEIDALDVAHLELRFAGAELTGKGAFTFDNSDLKTFEGMPAPDGALSLKLVGGNALIDKFVAMGLMSDDDAGGMRMMLGLFAVPGEGEDTLTSKIEVRRSGQILANGQRIK
ncbi:MAG: DUF2125 domain-containing protein [Roseovarius sp.]